ncbi:hypothetical protein SAMN05216252_13411 [Actinacidiphila glaucinigra]|uniref:Uncharacterized protein n=1 Tax=Actinacidiphila glaucinigra TaxID=235986 RepID=A0A239NBY6_9ACTN|nr:hypothetical protein SAMN05216252_13411 [Actinacidiphila glaucinigra]
MELVSPACASTTASWTPVRPRVRKERRKPVQSTASSLSQTAKPRISRRPSALTPVPITTACETTRWLTWAFQ